MFEALAKTNKLTYSQIEQDNKRAETRTGMMNESCLICQRTPRSTNVENANRSLDRRFARGLGGGEKESSSPPRGRRKNFRYRIPLEQSDHEHARANERRLNETSPFGLTPEPPIFEKPAEHKTVGETQCQRPTTNYLLTTTYHILPITNYLLPDYQLPESSEEEEHYQLPTT